MRKPFAKKPVHPPVPPVELPPARTVTIPGRGEFFLRDTGGDGPTVLLLHGWMVSADLNWCGAYDALAEAGYRVLAIDHRGHGRGLRAMTPFRLADCAADAAAVLRRLRTGPAIIVGYSLGGTVAQLIARDHPDVVAGVVFSGTCQHFQDPATRKLWKWMGVVGFLMAVTPRRFFTAGFKRSGIAMDETGAWVLSELMRHQSRDMAEAGRELGRFDSRPWKRPGDAPAAMVLTTRDTMVPPSKQRELAQAWDATVFEAGIDHLDLLERAAEYNPALLSAIAQVGSGAAVAAA